MKLSLPLLCLLLLTLIVPALASGDFDPATMLDVSQVRKGDQAVSRSVFSGITITEFRLEVIDVLRQANLGQDMILARVLDGPVVERKCGIVGGMSGSPVYIKGKLIGAIAWGWPFQKEPIAGITPIRAMLDTLPLMDVEEAQAPAPSRSWTAQAPFTVAGTRYTAAAVVTPGQRIAGNTLPLRPVVTPLNCSGFGPQTLKLIADKLGPRGLEPMAGGGGAAEPVPVDLEPGAAVGARFMEGDFDMTGIGTVTWREGNRILAFGHPLMQLGRVNMPLTTAWINEFVPNYQRTDKMGAGMANIGTLQADASWAIGGRIGPQAPLIPARIEIVNRTRNLTKVFNIKVFDEPGLTPVVLTIGISQALEAVCNVGNEATLRTRYEIRGKRGTSFRRDNQQYVQGSPALAATNEVAGMMQLLEENRWEPQGVAELSFRAEVSERDETAVIEKVFVEENVARAGKPLNIHVLVRPDGGELRDEVFTMDMPPDLPKGSIRIGVGGGDDAAYFRSRFGIMQPRFDSLSDIVSYLDTMEQNKQLCVVMALPTEGLMVGNTRLMRLPASISGVLSKSIRSDLDEGKEELFACREPGFVMYGRQMLVLPSEDRMGARGTVTASAPPAVPAAEPEGSSPATGGAAAASPLASLWWARDAFKPLPLNGATAKPTAAPAKKEPAAATPAADDDDLEAAADAAAAEEKKDDAKKPLVRQSSAWMQQKAADFAKGEADGIALPSDGGLALGPALQAPTKLPEGQVWNALSHGEFTYLATGAPGRIYRIKSNGKPELLSDPGVFAIRGMAVNAAGELFIGTWPGGKVFRIGKDGKAELFCKLPCDYVWALSFDQSGRLLAGTGPYGRLFAMDKAGKAEQILQLPQAHILSLLVSNGTVFMGTGSKGVVYALPKAGDLRAVISTDDDVTALATGDDGVAYAATAGTDGTVYRIGKDLVAQKMVSAKSLPIYGLTTCGGTLYAATGGEGKLLAITGDDRYETIKDSDATHLLCLAPCQDGFAVGGGNMGMCFRADAASQAKGSYVSGVLDAGRQAQWGVIDWQAAVPEGAALSIQTRSGQSPDPEDGSWSVWSAICERPGQEVISSPQARYLQYRVQMNAPAGVRPADLRLRWISLGYLPANQKPTVEFTGASVEQPWKGEVEIKWSAKDPDSDKLLTALEYRAAGIGDWQAVKQFGFDDTSYKWNTVSLKDGAYDLKLTVTDKAANPVAPLIGDAILYALRVDNTPPEIQLEKIEARDGKLHVTGIASDSWRLAEVAYCLDGRWLGVTPADGIFDGQYERFEITAPLDKDGKAKLTVRCLDTAGNAKSQEIAWPVAEEAKPEKAAG